MAVDVVVVGSCMTDLISYVPRLPKPGETLHGNAFKMGFGGKGANQCVAAAKLGASVAMVGKVGDDVFGHNYMKNFEQHQVNCDNMHMSSTSSTGMASISVAEDGANSIVIVAGANLELTEDDIMKAEPIISNCKVLICQLEINQQVTLAALKLAKKHGVFTILNPAPAPSTFNTELLKYTDIVCPNETESEIITSHPITNIDDAIESLHHFFELGCLGTVIITLGAKGCVFRCKSEENHLHVGCTQVSATDTTGAGDAFVGTLAYCLTRGIPLTVEHLSILVRISCDVATVSVQKKGTQDSYPCFDELSLDIQENFKLL
ncbi:hypothetical protein HELRODRAFT_91240 [Helobdella robusta]|uniref:Ribokinase n=1 Tax=Helobdella robusta TaxID=6412 RepID=T1G815_HELRO|nr:hypothetical protein HELRODRAFT_91240 [Helobdella robusta]ESN89903.1 hypothetical protein HELRODRAFT_91240 [Helobdella robusta]